MHPSWGMVHSNTDSKNYQRAKKGQVLLGKQTKDQDTIDNTYEGTDYHSPRSLFLCYAIVISLSNTLLLFFSSLTLLLQVQYCNVFRMYTFPQLDRELES